MSMWKQVWHVMKKDVRQFRWLIAAQVLATGAATYSAMSPAVHQGQVPWMTREFAIQGAWSALMMFLAVMLTVFVVQADSPSRSDAFWASRPLRPLAVLLAKAATVIAFAVAVPAVGEVIVLASHDVTGADMVPLIGDGALLLLGMLVGAAVLAALTTDTAAFFAAGVAAVVGFTVVGFAVERLVFPSAFNDMTPVPVALLGGLLGGSVLAYQYQRRNVRRSAWATVVGSVAGIVLLGAISAPAMNSGAATVSSDIIRSDVRWGDFDVEPLPRGRADAGEAWALRTTIQLGDVDPRYEYALRTGFARLTLADGTELQSRIRSGPLLTSASGGLVAAWNELPLSPAGAGPVGSEWTVDPLAELVAERLVVAHLSQAQLDLLRAEGGRLDLVRARVDVKTASEIGTLPLEMGATAEAPGQRFSVLSVGTAGSAGSMADIRWERVREYMDRQVFMPLDYVGYAFVDPATRDGVMAPSTRQYRLGHAAVFVGGWSTLSYTVAVETPTVFEDGRTVPARSADWFANSELLLIGVSSIGDYPIEAGTDVGEVSVPGQGGGT